MESSVDYMLRTFPRGVKRTLPTDVAWDLVKNGIMLREKIGRASTFGKRVRILCRSYL